ncbi:MAG: hypothetical protein ACXVEB_16330, partial [Bacteroidia bacterium]
MQTSLFDTIDTTKKYASSNGLVIKNRKRQPLNKQQQAFNRLVKKIEKLRVELQNTSAELDEKLSYYGKHIHPLEQELTLMRKEVVKLLFHFYTNKGVLTNPQKKTLKRFLSMQLNEILSLDINKPDAELEQIFKKINGVSLEDVVTQEFETMKDEMEEMFQDMGFDINLEDLNKSMTPEEMMVKLKNLEEEFGKQQDDKNSQKSSRKKTAKQLEKEEKERQVEDARNKNIKNIYKQLAKALHPDLEQDEEIKMQKELLMKRLTVAYNNNDLHTILSLEMEWIHEEEENVAELTNEKLSIYNQVLKEQVQELEEQKITLLNQPRFAPLFRYGAFYLGSSKVNLPREKSQLEEILGTIKM